MKSQEPVQLSIFDLNCWALRFLSKKRKERLALIGQLLSQQCYDLALLQEIWSDKDYSELRHRLSDVFPYTHRFKSGVIGSGLCVFSQFPIIDCLQYQFSLNGFPYMMNHGDWFCGKAVGLVKLKAYGFLCHVYVTHLHAEYCRENDCYRSHRILQSWELAQFIRHTSNNSDVVVLAGDLNMHPGDLGVKLVREWTGLKDSYLECTEYEGPPDGCTLIPSNPFTDPQELKNFPQGIRIDYIMYKSAPGIAVSCQQVTTGSQSSRSDTPFSDHEIVTATLRLQRIPGVSNVNSESLPSVVSPIFSSCCTEIYTGLQTAERWSTICRYLVIMFLFLLALQCSTTLLSVLGLKCNIFPPVLMTLLFLLLSSLFLVLHTAEQRQLQSVIEQINLVQHGHE
ncbi:hypothetical protein XENTR_v10005592 [Xenopus tropicalis]|uniref:sphingomyelin phosphodiesterase n=1 Tax=Xenopus tropicalis TaxID=8364 RepID=B0JZW9_XENTR|nr:sphingomyelin phosphodiesterase 2 [Xenopus tropicalis]XP_012811295.1 sphingomyelin phosphodiesterase 2 isoform X1 [Xenopus tropicalis]XP_012811303.1 sphingomyelin phosphodiesterase 2 isoform X1 [Xenopus tropicalis]XP_012811314.1 sphingomyelin phosphodiesterase 2 isoform X1 [Xenopus tropicalis]XP_012811319.1 sphingomyelin phosphodiesterase 2 isoform X1 [Xenopus tropicalis]XP_012811321.1 sphingomyelin phosphodiesterase 2 isoform X1 [Xenopus tropicalis]XP_031751542.1 sphingomyelin phosphodies|eukprot:XP_017946578.1 PREDICTED: sphingomyelin phosphodiesterase 2 isoform X1 [Xenopus tropicalis]